MRKIHLGVALFILFLTLVVATPATGLGSDEGVPNFGEAPKLREQWASTINELRDQLEAMIDRTPCVGNIDRRSEFISQRARGLNQRLGHLSDLEETVDSVGDLAPRDHIQFENRLRNLAAEVERLADQMTFISPAEDCMAPETAPRTLALVALAAEATGSISGTVTDAATTTGISGLYTYVYDAAGNWVANGYTDSNGDYTTSQGLPAGTYHVRTYFSAGYLDELYDNIPCGSGCDVTIGTPITVGDSEAVNGIDFALDRGGSISGTVTDAATTTGIFGSYVYIYDGSDNRVASASTDSNGDYATSQSLHAGTYYARTVNYNSSYFDELYDNIPCASGCDVTTGTPIVVGTKEDVTGIDFTLDKGGSISGTVTDAATTTGISGTRVYIFDGSGDSVASAVTEWSGDYRTSQPLPAGTYYARADDYSGYFTELYDNAPCASGCDVTTGTPIVVGASEDVTGIDFALDKGGSISGTVTDSATAAAIALGYIYVYDAAGDYVASASSDSNGDYTTSQALAAGTYYAHTENYSSYFNELYDNIPCASWCDATTGTPITVGAGEAVTGIDFALEKAGSISGTLTDAATNTGISYAIVDIFDGGENWVASGYTDWNGDYTTLEGLPAGTYYALSSARGYVNEAYDDILCVGWCNVTGATPIIVGAGVAVAGVDFALDKGGSISGTVTDAATTTGISDAYVSIHDGIGNRVTSGYTDSNGDYTTFEGLPAGTYYALSYSNSGYLKELYDNIPCASDCDVTTGTPIVVGASEDVTGIDFALDKGGSISGTVTDAATTTVIKGERVTIYDAAGNSVASAYTDSNGDYTTSQGLPTGTYHALAYSSSGYLKELYDNIPCASDCDVTTGTPITVGDSEDVTGIDFALDKGGSISGTVTDSATAAAIERGLVRIYDASGNYITYDYADVNGAYTSALGLPAGTYYALTFSYFGHLNELYDNIPCASDCDVTTGTPIVVGAREDVIGIDFALDKGGSISGTVTDSATAAAIALGYVYVYDAAGDFVASAYTDLNGDYTTSKGLPTGTYYGLTFSYSGYLSELYDNISCASGCDVTTGTPIVVGASEDVTGIDFSLDKGGSISGTVTDSATAAASAFGEIYVYDAAGDAVAYAFTDLRGDYKTFESLPTGTYYALTVNHPGYFNELYDNIPCASGCDVTTGTPITVGAGEAVIGIDFELDKGGSISGTVTDAATTIGISGSNVYIYDGSGNSVASASTDSNGDYATSQSLPSGTYYALTDNHPGYLNELYDNTPCASGCDVTTGTPIAVVAGETTRWIDFSLSPDSAMIFYSRFESGDISAWSSSIGGL